MKRKYLDEDADGNEQENEEAKPESNLKRKRRRDHAILKMLKMREGLASDLVNHSLASTDLLPPLIPGTNIEDILVQLVSATSVGTQLTSSDEQRPVEI